MIKVKQLIEILSQVDEDLEVMLCVSSVDGDWSQSVHLNPSDVNVDTPTGDFVSGVGTDEEDEEYDEDRQVLLITVESV